MSKKEIIIIASIVTACLIAIGVVMFTINRNNAEDTFVQISSETPPAVTTPTTPEPPTGESPTPFAIAPSALGHISITPLSTGSLGIERDASFLITSDTQALTEEHLRAYLSVGSGENFTLEPQPQKADNAFILRFEETLAPAQIYTLVYSPTGMQPTSHAFQTTDIFRITATTPANSTHNIPHNSGIEVTFSQALANASNFEAAFVITPHVEGKFLQRDNTYIFAPEALAFNTVYTITIKPGLTSVTGETITEYHTFSFTTRWGTATERPFSIAGSVYEIFLPWSEVFIALNVSQNFPHRDFVVNLYDLQTPENFLHFETPGEFIETFEVELYSFIDEWGWQSFNYLFLGRTLPEGYYLATIQAIGDPSELVLNKFIQVSALSVYSLSIAGETVFWIHDAITHYPAAGATININGSTVTTDADGIAIAPTQHDSQAVITIMYANYLPFAYTKRTFAPARLTPSGRFLTYMYTDRPSYRPTDTVDIFGVIMPRYGQAILPSDVFTLHIGDMLEFPITPDAHGAFNMRIPVEGMFGFTDIVVNANGERLMSTWVNFLDYTNISFVLDGQIDKNAYFFGEDMQVEISVANFAGIPVDGISLRSSDGETTIVTDESGIAAGEFPAGWHHLNERQGWGVFRTAHWFNVASDAQRTQGISLPFIMAPRDIMLEVEEPGDGTAILTSSRITLDRFNADDSLDVTDLDNFRSQSVDIDFTVLITRHVTTQTLRSRRYDHINRRTVNIYDFNTTSSTYRTISERTQNGTATITDIPGSDDPLIRYSVEIRYNDSRGLPTSVFLHSQWFEHRNESTIRHFGFRLEGRTVDTDEWGWWFNTRDLGVGESTDVVLQEAGPGSDIWWGNFSEATTPTTGRILTVLARDGILSATAGSPTGTPITFPEDAISNALLFGAYFDRGYIFSIPNAISVHYDFMERELQIALDFDREQYAPGDEVTVTIQTTDADGQAVPSRVTISVVDESSIIGWGQHSANFLSRLYTSSPMDIWTFQSEQFTSHTQHNFGAGTGGGAEGGGGDGSGNDPIFREDFVDNPIFEVVQTDENGMATLTFTLPDQVTSWRVTAIGLTQGGLAGDARPNIISTLPFFVDLIRTNEYIVGDDIAAVARVFTDGTMSRELVDFVFEILQDGEVIFTDTQTSAGRAVLNADKLATGLYTMRVAATMGSYRDAMELPFIVVESGMIFPVSAMQQISPDIPPVFDFDMHPLPVRVTLTNGNIRPLMNILHSTLNWNSVRTDHMAARAFANEFHGWQDGTDIGANLHAPSGGIPELPYEEPTLFYTARFAASFPELVSRDHIIRFVGSNADRGSSTVRAARLLALAAVGEPVLLEIQEEFESVHGQEIVGSDNYLAMLYLTTALVALGDDTGAYNFYNRLSGLVDHDNIMILGNPGRETAETLMLFINTAINPQAAWEHLQRNSVNRFVSDVPERINFVRRAIVMGDTISEVQFDLNGQTQTARLENFDARVLHISAEQFENLNLSATNGETDLHVQFYGYNAQNWNEDDNRLDISKNIVRDGELYRVDFVIDFPQGDTGFFTIYNRLPSNMRFVPTRRDWGRNWAFVSNPQQQLMEISFARTPNCFGSRTVSFHAMKLFDADMSEGVTYISNRNAQNHIWGSTR